MPTVSMKQLIEAGVHFGHQTRRWNPKMAPYIFGERNGIHIIDLRRTLEEIDRALDFVRDLAAGGGVVLFVGTKKQAQAAVREAADRAGMPYVNFRWLGGMLTNFKTINQRIFYMKELAEMEESGDIDQLPKKERLRLRREFAHLHRTLGGVEDMDKPPSAVFVIDLNAEHIAVREAVRLDIPVIALVDTNCNPDDIDFVIPGNDDAIRAASLIADAVSGACLEGLRLAQEEAEGSDEGVPEAGAAAAAEQESEEAEEKTGPPEEADTTEGTHASNGGGKVVNSEATEAMPKTDDGAVGETDRTEGNTETILEREDDDMRTLKELTKGCRILKKRKPPLDPTKSDLKDAERTERTDETKEFHDSTSDEVNDTVDNNIEATAKDKDKVEPNKGADAKPQDNESSKGLGGAIEEKGSPDTKVEPELEKQVTNDTTTSNDEAPKTKPRKSSKSGTDSLGPMLNHLLNRMGSPRQESPDSPVIFARGGPKTEESIETDTLESDRIGRSGSKVTKEITEYELTEEAKELEKRFCDMIRGEYNYRCQICGNYVRTYGGKPHTFVTHIIKPSKDLRTNHPGNLLNLCGWHHTLISYGQWSFLHPVTAEPITNADNMYGLLKNVTNEHDDHENTYKVVLIRFYEVYEQWEAKAKSIDQTIRFSEPHWKYFCRRFE